MSKILIETVNLKKTYKHLNGNITLFNDLNLKVKKGELIAKDKNGDIFSPANGRILMPLYQKQGEDGFFIIKEINV